MVEIVPNKLRYISDDFKDKAGVSFYVHIVKEEHATVQQ